MSDVFGGKAKFTSIPVPIGVKHRGKVVEVKLSEKYDDCVSIAVEFPQFKAPSRDGKKEFVKRSFYTISLDWSPKNKSGKLYQGMTGRLPSDEEQINWTRLLLGKEVECIFESVLDDYGEMKGDKICWMGAPGVRVSPTGIGSGESATLTPPPALTGSRPGGILVERDELQPDEDIPF